MLRSLVFFPYVFRTAIFRLSFCLLLVHVLTDRTICSAFQLEVLGLLLTFRLSSLLAFRPSHFPYDRRRGMLYGESQIPL